MKSKSAITPWLVLLALAPLVALAATYFLGEGAPTAPIVDRETQDLARHVKPPDNPVWNDEGPVIFLGDSRYRELLRAVVGRGKDARRKAVLVETPKGNLQVMAFFAIAGSTLVDLHAYIDDIFGWKPRALVIQPELLVYETTFRGLLKVGSNQADRRAEAWGRAVVKWGDQVEMPTGGQAIAIGHELADRAHREGVRLLVAQIPPSAEIAGVVPEGYYDRVRDLICPILEECERDYLRFASELPDKYFRDPLHLSVEGQKAFFPELAEGLAAALSE